MKTITYTYDETRCTNKDYLILELTESIDDGGAGYEAVAEYNIDCPYRHNRDCLNDHEGNQYGSEEYREGCVRCKFVDAYITDNPREPMYDTEDYMQSIREVLEDGKTD